MAFLFGIFFWLCPQRGVPNKNSEQFSANKIYSETCYKRKMDTSWQFSSAVVPTRASPRVKHKPYIYISVVEMSSLFLVGVLLVGPEGTSAVPSAFAAVKQVADLGELFVSLYKQRLETSVSLCFETGVSVIVVDDNQDLLGLRQLLARFIPVGNFVVVHLEDWSPQFFTSEKFQESLDNQICGNRIKRLSQWMYNDSQCSANVYSMISHFQHSSATISERNRLPVPRFIRNIDFLSLLHVPRGPQHYMDLLSTWEFSATALNTHELIYCSFILIKELSEEANCTIPDNKLLLLLFTLESSYHQVNKFHNFKHAVDVMQATWQLCEKLLPKENVTFKLLLCMAAIGHDMAHPGTNNKLIVDHNSQIATHFHGISVLENLHQELFQNLLFDQWPRLVDVISKSEKDDNFNIVTKSILATDMAMHNQFVSTLQDTSSYDIETLVAFIIKAADISNVTRPLHISAQWALLISLEFEDCALLEVYVKTQITDCPNDDENIKDQDLLLPVDDIVRKYPGIPNGQLFFINTFAEQFFNKLSSRFPILQYLSDNIEENKIYWKSKKI